MEPCAPGTEDDLPIMYSTLTKKENEQERLLNQKAFLKNGKYDNVFELSFLNGAEHWYCNACECPVMGRVFQHELGRRHTLNISTKTGNVDNSKKDSKDPEESVLVEVAPGEPLPPGFEDIGRVSQIQDRLDGFKVGPLVALEYLIELQDDDPMKEPFYLCILCDKKGDPRTVLTHLASYNHISQYLQKHFPTCWRILAPYNTKQYRRNWQTALQKIAEGIETKFGRLKPFPIDKDKFEKDRMEYLKIVGKGIHFSESSGYTFEELVVPDELTKTLEVEEKSYESSAAHNWGNWAYIQKPFKKRSPSPPVVGVPLKRTKGNAQTNPRKQEVAFVTQPGDLSANKPNKPQNVPMRKPNEGDREQDRQLFGRPDRRSLSSVSSLSDKSDKSDDDNFGRERGTRGRQPLQRGGKQPTLQRGGRQPALQRGGKQLQMQRDGRQPPLQRGGRQPPIQRDGRQPPLNRDRQPPYGRRRSPSPRRRSPVRRKSPSPRRRSPVRRRSPSPVHSRRRSQSPTYKAEQEKEKLRKIEEFRKLGRAIENDMFKTLKQHEKNPEKHPQYNEEWKKFWNKRYKELKIQGVDVSKHDFKPEWIEFWNKRMVEIHSDELRNRKEALRKRLALPDEMNPIKFKIGAGPITIVPDKGGFRPLPMAAQPDQDNEVIIIDDKDDEKDRKGAKSPWEDSPKRGGPTRKVKRSPSPRHRRSRSRDRSPARKELQRHGKRLPSRDRSRSTDRSLLKKRQVLKEQSRLRNTSPISDTSHNSRSRDHHPRGRDSSRSDSRHRSTSRSNNSPQFKRSTSREKSYERKRLVRESSFERDLRGRERIRTVADLPWERERDMMSVYRNPYLPPPMMRDVTRKPVDLMGIEEDDHGEVNVVDVLRILTALEDRLGSLGPKVIDLLAQALALEKNEAHSSEQLLDNEINCVLFETVKEKLKGQMFAGLVDHIQHRAFKKAIQKIASLIHLAGQRKRQADKLLPKISTVPSGGPVDKAAIAKQIANALIAQGKTDVTQAELEQLINAVVGMAEASKISSRPMTTAGFLEMLGGSFSSNKNEESQDKNTKLDIAGLDKLTEPLTPSPGKNSTNNMENLSDSDLQTLLQNFKDLSTEEQHNLISYLKKLEYQEPERVEKLRKFVNLDPNSKSKEDTKEAAKEDSNEENEENRPKSKSNGRESPFSNRSGLLNPIHEDLVNIESEEETAEKEHDDDDINNETEQDKPDKKVNVDSEEDEYTFEDVVKTVSKNVKDKEIEHSKKVLEETMKYDKSKSNLKSTKDLISDLMSNITKNNSSGSNAVDLLGLGKPAIPAPKNVPTVDLSKLLNINMASLASIVNNVKNMSNEVVDKQLSFKPPSPARNQHKLNFDLGQLKPELNRGPTSVGKDLESNRPFVKGPGPEGPIRFDERGGGLPRELDRFGPGPDRIAQGGPDRFGPGGPDRFAPGAPDQFGFGGPERFVPGFGNGGPDRFGHGGPDRFGPAASDRFELEGPDRFSGGYGPGPDRFGPGGGPDRFGPGGAPDRFGLGGGPDRFGSGVGPDRFGPGGGPDRFGPGGGPDRFGPGGNAPDRFGTGGNPDRFGPVGKPDRFGQGTGADRFGPGAGPERFGSGGGPDRFCPGGPMGFGIGPDRGFVGAAGDKVGRTGGPNLGINRGAVGPGNQLRPNPLVDNKAPSNFGPNQGAHFVNESNRGPARQGPTEQRNFQRLPAPDFNRQGGNVNRW